MSRGVFHRSVSGADYRPMRSLGRGASAEVMEVVGPRGDRCAMKVLRRVLCAGDGASRLAREAHTLASLRHPNLVPVLDTGMTADGRPFLIMPRLVGETLRDRLDREHRLAPEVACDLLAGALDGLAAAHAVGVVHRDVKPANLFLVREHGLERTVVLDFGIAKVTELPMDPSTGAQVIGTPRYLAPEQLLAAGVDGRTDVYAAGVVLFEMLAGRGPFEAADPLAIMRAHLEDDPLPIARFAAVPPALEHAVARALAKPPEARWPTARAFAAALRRMGARGAPGLAAGRGAP